MNKTRGANHTLPLGHYATLLVVDITTGKVSLDHYIFPTCSKDRLSPSSFQGTRVSCGSEITVHLFV